MKRLISRFLLSAVVPLGCVALFASPSLAATVSLPSAFTFGNQSFNQVYTNDNGTLSFGDAYIASGPGTNFLTPPSTVQGIIAAGFGDYSSTNNWTSSALANGTLFNFSGTDSLNSGTNTFSVALLNDSSFQIAWNSIVADPLGSISVGLYVPGVLNNNELNPGGSASILAPNTPFFYDYSLNGADPQSSLNGGSLTTSFAVPEPSDLPGLFAFGSMALLLRQKRTSAKASK
jgi:hypothetical protein